MNSRKVGKVKLDPKLVAEDLAIIDAIPRSPAYKEYAIGEWSSAMLRNRSGHSAFGTSEEYDGHAISTDIGQKLSYLNELIDRTFVSRLIKSVRIFEAKDRSIIRPHRDYLEFKKGFTRLHLPLRTNPLCLNSEGDEVYHMSAGEVWYLDGRKTHAGGNLASGLPSRIHLVLDFDPEPPIEDLFLDKSAFGASDPELVERPPLTDEEMDAILGIAAIVNEANFEDFARALSFLHFFRRADSSAVYDWANGLAENSLAPGLMTQAKTMKSYFLGV